MFATLLALAIAAPTSVPLFAPDNLVAWCIVPFDAQKRSPEDRAAMLARLGFRQFAYDWRAEHVPTFERELLALKKHRVKLSALWFPGGLSRENRTFMELLKKHEIRTQLWVMLVDFPAKDQAGKVQQAVEFLKPIAETAAQDGHSVALYNHGGWGGEPENQLAVIAALKRPNVGIVYNLHHGHDHLPRFAELLKKMQPHLLTLNLNGMVPSGDKKGQKIVPLGHGSEDAKLLQILQQSGYRGPIGILGHTGEDAEARLRDNLDGLRWLLAQSQGSPRSAQPAPRTPTGMAYLLHATTQPAGFKVQLLMPEWQRRFQDLPAADLEKLLRVYPVSPELVESRLGELTPMLGEWKRNGNQLQFMMKFPPQEGKTYRAYLDIGLLNGDKAMSLVSADLQIPAVKREPTAKVVQVFPTADELPENTLRLYFEFSAPMRRGNVYQHIRLLDDKNQVVKYPFLELDQELWSPDSTRFTLLFDPGRVKKGLVPREELGPPLEEGKTYTLEIAANWLDDAGTPMKEAFRKRFRAGKPVERGLDLNRDFVQPATLPMAGSRTPYTISFGKRLLDAALAQRMIWIESQTGERIAGKISLGAKEQSWNFTPDVAWGTGPYQVKIDARLEDVCGNRVGEAFEVDTFKPIEKRIEVQTAGWSFTPKNPN